MDKITVLSDKVDVPRIPLSIQKNFSIDIFHLKSYIYNRSFNDTKYFILVR
jgi:hypothetical protein